MRPLRPDERPENGTPALTFSVIHRRSLLPDLRLASIGSKPVSGVIRESA